MINFQGFIRGFIQLIGMEKTIENDFFKLNYGIGAVTNIGSISIKKNSEWIRAINEISIKSGRKKLKIHSYSEVSTIGKESTLFINFFGNLSFKLKIEQDSPVVHIEPDFYDVLAIQNLTLEFKIDFHGVNQYDYLNFSGNKYRKLESIEKFSLKVPPTGAFGQVWTVHSKDLYCGLIGLNQSEILNFSAKSTTKDITLSQKVKVNFETRFCIIAGKGEKITPIREKLLKILPIKPLPIKYANKLESEAKLSFETLYNHFLIDCTSGKSPSSFIMYYSDGKEGFHYKKLRYTTIGNCFSVGYITGPMALYLWKKELRYLEILLKELLPPILNDALIQSGPIAGSYLDTYNQKLGYWTTGRVQDPKKGFTDWFPVKRDKKGTRISWVAPPLKPQLKNGLWHYIVEKYDILSRELNNPGVLRKYDQLIVSPPYSGQIAYNLLQVYVDLQKSQTDPIFVGDMEEKLKNSIRKTVDFLLKYQKNDGLWDQELNEDGTTFWNQETGACIYPATMLFWWGVVFDEEKIFNAGKKGLLSCIKLLEDGEYYGVYFETDAANRQGDLVTAIACIKCFSKAYELTKEEKWLDHARRAAWHLLSYMWGTGVRDRKNNVITGGMPVTTYKSMGFPVIGGSELCQAIEGLLELSFWDRTFLVYAEAGLGFHSHYMYFQHNDDRGTNEILWGTLENWSTSTSVDFASYATGPLIRSLYLYSKILDIDKNTD